MATKRKIEVFSAGCSACEEAVALIKRLACASCGVEVLDMRDSKAAERAKRYGIKRVPAVAVDGRLAECCAGNGINEASLRAAGIEAA